MTSPQSSQMRNPGEIHILDYLIVLFKNSRMIIFVSLGVIVVVYLVLWCLPNKYTASSRLLPPQQNVTLSAQLLNSLGGGGTPGASASNPPGMTSVAAGLLGLKSPSDLYASMMVGNTIYDRIIERFKLRQLFKEKYIEEARKVLGKRAKINVDKKDGMITIAVTDKDRKRAADIANAFGEELDTLLRGLAVQEAKGRLAFLEKERDLANQNLARAENGLRSFSEQNSVVQLDTQTRGVLEYIARLRAEIDAKEVQIQVMRQQATRFNYDVVRMETEVKGLKEKLATTEKQYDTTCASDVCFTTSKAPTLMLEYLRLYREVKFQEGLYQLYTKMVELARLDMVKDFPVVQVVDAAKPPEKRSNARLLPALLAGIASFVTLLFVAFGRESWERVRQNQENSQRLALLDVYISPWKKLIGGWTSKFKR